MDCRGAAAEQVALVLRIRLEEMCSLRQKALDWSSPDGVHDMRVASRRLRSAMADLRPYLHKQGLPRDRLKAIARRLGEVRDHDVALPVLEQIKAKTGGNVEIGLDSIIEERRHQLLGPRAALEEAISTRTIAELNKDFLSRLKLRPARAAAKSKREKTFRQAGVAVISNRLKQFTDGADCIYHPLRSKQLHKLRILAKRLRYAVELFAVCWSDELKQIAKEIARLQTSLGGLHDCDVWIAECGQRLGRKTKTRNLHEDEAAVWLLRHFCKERADHYRDALARWHDWEKKEFLPNLKLIVHARAKPAAKPDEALVSNGPNS